MKTTLLIKKYQNFFNKIDKTLCKLTKKDKNK